MEDYIKNLDNKIGAILDGFGRDISGIRGNRPTPQLLENIKINCYGQVLPLKQLGSLNVVPPREIDVNLWDKSIIKIAVKAIDDAKLGVTASDDGNIIRVSLPVLSEERRKEFVRQVSRIAEESRIQIRRERDEINKEVKSAEGEGVLSEDQRFKALKKIQEIIDGANKKINSSAEAKTGELMRQ